MRVSIIIEQLAGDSRLHNPASSGPRTNSTEYTKDEARDASPLGNYSNLQEPERRRL
jgi:hypothetical protein